MALTGWAMFEPVQQLLEALAVFGQVDGVGRGAQDRHAGVFEGLGELQRGLAAELDDDAEQSSRSACSTAISSSTSSAVSGSKYRRSEVS